MTLRRPFVLSFVAVLAVSGGYALWVFSGPGVVDPPTVDTESLEPRVAEALDQARRAVQQDPSSVELWGRYAMLLDTHHRIPAAAICYRAAERLDPSDFRWPYMLAQCLTDEDPSQVIAAFERARALRADYVPVYLHLGRLYLVETVGGRELARERYAEAIRLDPASSHAMWGLARLAFDDGDLSKSRGWLEDAAQRAPEHREVHALLARVLARLGEDTAAAVAQRKAEAQSGRYPIRDPVRGQVHVLALDSGRMLAKARKALSMGRTDVAMDALGHAAEALRVMRGRHPEDEGFRARLVHALSQLAWLCATNPDARVRDAPRGLSLAGELVELAPDDPHSLRVLAAAKAESGVYSEAKGVLDRARRMALSRGDVEFADRTEEELGAYVAGRAWRDRGR